MPGGSPSYEAPPNFAEGTLLDCSQLMPQISPVGLFIVLYLCICASRPPDPRLLSVGAIRDGVEREESSAVDTASVLHFDTGNVTPSANKIRGIYQLRNDWTIVKTSKWASPYTHAQFSTTHLRNNGKAGSVQAGVGLGTRLDEAVMRYRWTYDMD